MNLRPDADPRDAHGTRPPPPTISVVIPTYDRRDRLLRMLGFVRRQRTTLGDGRHFDTEIIVVSDGSTDGTADAVRAIDDDRIVLVEQPNAGPAAARNTGIERSRGSVVVFLDDDVMPGPGCVAAHAELHDRCDDVIAIGPMSTPTDFDMSPWVAWEQHQLEKQYDRFAAGGRAYARQFYTGNASARRDVLLDAGGFDTTFLRAEDVELARRLDDAGMDFVFLADAAAVHHAERSFASWRNVAHDYGRNDVIFAREGRPETVQEMHRFFAERHPLLRALVHGVVTRRRIAAASNRLLSGIALGADKLGLAGTTRRSLSAVYALEYYGGVLDEVGSPAAFEEALEHGRIETRPTT